MTRAVTTSDGFRIEFNPRGGMNYSLHNKPWPAPGKSENLVILIESLAKEIERLASSPSAALEGFALVPIEPTPEMHEAGYAASLGWPEPMNADFPKLNSKIYKAMIAAALTGPQPKEK